MRLIYASIFVLFMGLFGCTSTAVVYFHFDEASEAERQLLLMDRQVDLLAQEAHEKLKQIMPNYAGLKPLIKAHLIQRRNQPEITDSLIEEARRLNPSLSEVDILKIQFILFKQSVSIKAIQDQIFDQRSVYYSHLNSPAVGTVLRSFGYPKIPLTIPGRGYEGWAQSRLNQS